MLLLLPGMPSFFSGAALPLYFKPSPLRPHHIPWPMGGLRKFTDEGEMVPALEKLTVHWEKQIDNLIIVTHCGGAIMGMDPLQEHR